MDAHRGGHGGLRLARRGAVWFAYFVISCPIWSGCAALTNPVADGIRVQNISPDLLGRSKDGDATIPLTLLGQEQPPTHRLDAGDVLGVWIEGIHGDRNVIPPLHVAPQVLGRDQYRMPPAVGVPVTVDDNGTITLPMIDAVKVKGLSVAEAREAIRRTYVGRQLLPAGRERVFVTLLQPRLYSIVVMRQESAGFLPGTDGTSKRGTGHLVELPAYENDVLHALAQTGGLPGLDDQNEVIIFRGFFPKHLDPALRQRIQDGTFAIDPSKPPAGAPGQVVRIPLRVPAHEPIPVNRADVVLHSGDVVFLEARERAVYFTGGLLPSGEFALPRDHDLDVVEAVCRAHGPLVNGAFSTNNLAGNLIEPGIGGPSPSLLSVLRRRPCGGREVIKVDLNRALRGDPDELLRVLPGDVLILQEKPSEALARYISQTVLNFSLSWQALHQRFATGVIDVNAPQRIPARIGIESVNGAVVPVP